MNPGGWFDRSLIVLACAGAVLLLSMGGCNGEVSRAQRSDAERCRALCAPRPVAELTWIGSCTCVAVTADGGGR